MSETSDEYARVATVCGASVCPTCGRQTEALIGPCAECCDLHARTGKFLRRVRNGATDG